MIMGLFDSLFGKANSHPPSSSSGGQEFVESITSKLLKQATEQKRSGNIEGAIVTLKKAYEEAAILKDIDIDAYLRLPMYYQEAGHTSEAWAKFIDLLENGYPGQIHAASLVPMTHSIIYDKMRLFLQRDKRAKEAVSYGIMSYISWATGLSRQNRTNELEHRKTAEKITEMITPLTKKAKCTDKLQPLTDITTKFLNQARLPSMAEVERETKKKLDLTSA
jgi:hypothetical protein